MFSVKSHESEESVMDQLLSELEDSDDDSPPPPGETPRQRLLRKARVSAKRRRDAEDSAMKVLAETLPGRSDLTVSLDKATVIRMAIAFLRLKNYFSNAAAAIEDAPAAVKQEEATDLVLYTDGVPEAEAMLNSLDGFLMMVARDGKIIYVSDFVLNYLGMLPHQMIGKHILEFVHEDDAKEMKSQLGWCVRAPSPSDDTSDPLPHESDVLGDNSKLEVDFYVRMKSHLTKNKKRTKQILYTVVHLQGRLVMEPAEFNKKLLRGTHMTCLCRTMRASIELEISSEGTMFMSRHRLPDMKFTFCDGRVSNLIGYAPTDMIGVCVFDFHNPLDSYKISNCHSNLKVKGTSVSKFYRFLGKSGDWVWMQTKATIVYDQNNKPLYVVCMNYVISPEEGRKALLDENPESPQSPDCRGVTTFTDSSSSPPRSLSSTSPSSSSPSSNSIPRSPKPKRRCHGVEAECSVPTSLPMAAGIKTETQVVSPDTQAISLETQTFPSDTRVIPSETRMIANETRTSLETRVIPPETLVLPSQPEIWPGCRCGQHRTKEECDISGNHCHIFDKWLDGLDEPPPGVVAGGMIGSSQVNFDLEFTKNTTVQEMLGKIMQLGGSAMPLLEDPCSDPEPLSAPTMRQKLPPLSLNPQIPVPHMQKTPPQALKKAWSLREALLAPNSPGGPEDFDHGSNLSSSSGSSPKQLDGTYDSDYRDMRVVPVAADKTSLAGHQSSSPVSYNDHHSSSVPVSYNGHQSNSPVSYNGHQSNSPVSYNGHQSNSPVSYNGHQSNSPVSYNGHQSNSPVSYNGHQSNSPVSYNGHQSNSPVSYNGHQSSFPVSYNGHQSNSVSGNGYQSSSPPGHAGFQSSSPANGHQSNNGFEKPLLGHQVHKGWNQGYNSSPVERSADNSRLQQPNGVWRIPCDRQSLVEGIADLPTGDVSVCGISQRDRNTWEPAYRPAQAPLSCAEVSSTTGETHQQRLNNSWNLVDKPLHTLTREHTCQTPQFRNNLTSAGSTVRPSVNSLSGSSVASQQFDGLWQSSLPQSPEDEICSGAGVGVTADVLDDLLFHLSSSSKSTCM